MLQSCFYIPPSLRSKVAFTRTPPYARTRGPLEQQGARWYSGALSNSKLTSNLSSPKLNAPINTALPAAFTVSSPSSSTSPTANVGISLEPSRPITTPLLTPDKSQPSPPTTLLVLPTTHFPFSEMTARATRVRVQEVTDVKATPEETVAVDIVTKVVPEVVTEVKKHTKDVTEDVKGATETQEVTDVKAAPKETVAADIVTEVVPEVLTEVKKHTKDVTEAVTEVMTDVKGATETHVLLVKSLVAEEEKTPAVVVPKK
ncbi:hypothetical protein LWI28_013412 [Acer negundo]|uniref:Uncharacterized protein n=1 Tax=Acer negundo TaxID=4023 RepID=A0AAD5IEQ3_ACENE|nr:hypothetical protein LWI28_013412 [Acer negundo]